MNLPSLTSEQQERLDRVLDRRDKQEVRNQYPGRASGSLSHREIEVLRLVAEGDSNQEIAEKLVIGLETVKSHMRRCVPKLGARNRTHAAVVALRSGLID